MLCYVILSIIYSYTCTNTVYTFYRRLGLPACMPVCLCLSRPHRPGRLPSCPPSLLVYYTVTIHWPLKGRCVHTWPSAICAWLPPPTGSLRGLPATSMRGLSMIGDVRACYVCDVCLEGDLSVQREVSELHR